MSDPSGQPGPGWGAPPGGPTAPGSPVPPAGAPPGWSASPGWDRPDPPRAPRPGVVPLRPLTVGELLDGALQAVRRNPRPMVVLPVVVGAVYGLLSGLLVLVVGPGRSLSGAGTDAATPGQAFADAFASVGALLLAGIPLAVLFGLAVVAVTAVLTVVAGRAVLGERTTTGQAWRFARGRVLPVLGLSLVLGVALTVVAAVVLGLLGGIGVLVAATTAGVVRVLLLTVVVLAGVAALVALGLVYLGRLGVATVTVVLDGRFPDTAGAGVGVFAAVARTWRLTKGSTWRNLGVLLLVQLLAGVVSQVFGTVVGIVVAVGALGAGSAAPLVTAAGTVVTSVVSIAVTLPFTAAAATLLYLDVRMRREGLDLELANAAEAAHPAGWDR